MKLIKDSIWNILSIGIPALVAIPIFSLISKKVGFEIFGIYTLSFAIVGYASIFDLGLSRAVIREVAIHVNHPNDINYIVNTAFSVVVILGLLSCLIILLTNSFLVDFIGVSLYFKADVIKGMQWLAYCLPLLLVSQIWLSYFEGLSNFKSLSIFKTLSNILIVVLPYLMVLVRPTFSYLMMGMLSARLIAFLISYFWISKKINIAFHVDKDCLKRLLYFGGWFTVSSVVGPIMVYFDRFILSSLIGAKNVAFYTAPSELVMRLLSLPNAGARVLFTRFSNTAAGNERRIYFLSIIILGVSAFALSLPLFIFAEKILVLWMGQSFVGEPVLVFRILLLGFVFNAIAQVPFNNLQAKGFSKLTALVHCVEVVPYLIILFFFTYTYGMLGVALAWTLRITFDTLIFLYLDFYKGNKNE